jgi:hypothetical protein
MPLIGHSGAQRSPIASAITCSTSALLSVAHDWRRGGATTGQATQVERAERSGGMNDLEVRRVGATLDRENAVVRSKLIDIDHCR